jgi:NAD(P)H-dependent flavin oxidoreductase YrpB (nitropropane dioxygenase family)
MLAGVDYVLMGAGIPREIPGVLDALAEHRVARLKLDVEGPAGAVPDELVFDPAVHLPGVHPPLQRPRFIPIVSASSLAATLARKATGRVDGFVVEGPTAGGHNAPPRGELRLSPDGGPLYGERDVVDLGKIRELGLPFWIAGGAGTPDALRDALGAGAAGVQVGTLFAYCDESGFDRALKDAVLAPHPPATRSRSCTWKAWGTRTTAASATATSATSAPHIGRRRGAWATAVPRSRSTSS